MRQILVYISRLLFLPGHALRHVKSQKTLLLELRSSHFDLVIVEKISDLECILQEVPSCQVIVAPQIATLAGSVEAIQKGAIYYTESLEDLARWISQLPQKAEGCLPLRPVSKLYPKEMIAENLLMKKVLSEAKMVANSKASILICGESGTGKEVVASYIHHASCRRLYPFIKVNCAAIPESLVESEFFGHEKGAFTGAVDKRAGRFERADKGTLLLDEVSEIPLLLQSKLLRVIQEQEFERVGGHQLIHVDVRLIATSNRNMQDMVARKEFREDLYFRLNVIPLYLPPLRERKEDILELASYFLRKFCKENQKMEKTLSASAKAHLLEYPWPGNVRQLANVMERAVILQHQQLLEPGHLFLEDKRHSLCSAEVTTLAEVEKLHILKVFAKCHKNKVLASKMLGLNVRTLRTKLASYQVETD